MADKNHVSFSEITTYRQCGWRWHLVYELENWDQDRNIETIFGSAVHQYIENVIERSDFRTFSIMKSFMKSCNSQKDYMFSKNLDAHKLTKGIFLAARSVFEFIKKEFPDIERIECEHKLYEKIEGVDKHFKGYVDLIIHLKNGKKILIDLKTAKSAYMWKQYADTEKLYQVVLYKQFYGQESGIVGKDIDCHYLIVSRDKFDVDKHSITSGPKKIENANTWLTNNIKALSRGMKMKNKSSCKFCQFKDRKDLCS